MSEFPKKLLEKIPEDLIEEIPRMTEDEIKERVIKSETVIVDISKEMEDDGKLAAIKEDLKALTGGYRDVVKAQEAIIKYCVYVLRSRGSTLTETEE